MTKSRHLRVAFRLNDSEHELITWAAKARGISVSAYVRLCAIERAGHAVVTIKNYKPVVTTREVDTADE